MDEYQLAFNLHLCKDSSREPPTKMIDKRYTVKYSVTLPPIEDLKPTEMSKTKVNLSLIPDKCPFVLPPISQKRATRRRPLPITHLSELNIFYPPMMPNFRTIKDIEPNFFSIINGRPSRLREMNGEYKFNLDKLLLKRHGIMRYMEVMLMWDYNFQNENIRFDKISVELDNAIRSYEMFLGDDHEFSMRLVNAQRTMYDEMKIFHEAFKMTSIKEASQRRQIMNLYNLIIRYLDVQAFMYHISPKFWRTENNIDTIDFRSGFVWIGESEKRYVDIKVGNVGEVHDSILLDELHTFVNRLKSKKPLLYFKTAVDLQKYFDTMVGNCFFSWNQSQILSHVVCAMGVKLVKYRDESMIMINEMNSTINDLTKDVMDWEKYLEAIKQTFSRTLQNIVPLFSSVEIANLTLHVDNTYECLIAKNETGRRSVSLLRDIEILRERLMMKLDFIDVKVVRAVEKEVYTEDLKKQTKAKKVHKNLTELIYLTNNLKKAFEPPKRRELLHKRRRVASYKRKKIKRSSHNITDVDFQHLSFFTDWCQGEDPTVYLNEINDMKWLTELDDGTK